MMCFCTFFQVTFAVGQTTNATNNKEVVAENAKYKDLIIGDYQDAYTNNSYKVFSALYWVDQYCSRPPFTVKVDENVLINPTKMLEYLQTRTEIKDKNYIRKFPAHRVNGSFYCSHKLSDTPIRDPDSKYYVSEEHYPKERFRDYCQGLIYLFDTVITSVLWRGTAVPKFLCIEDAYFSGIVRARYDIGLPGPSVDTGKFILILDNVAPDNVRSEFMQLTNTEM